jgi:hypothetical protein
VPSSALAAGPVLAQRPSAPTPPPATRFFPLGDESEEAPADPLENPRPDWLGVRTTAPPAPVSAAAEGLSTTSSVHDGQAERASVEQQDAPPPSLPLVVAIAAPNGTPTIVAEVAPSPARAASAPASPAPARGDAITLEYADDPATATATATPPAPALAGRPRLDRDGTLVPGPRRGRDPVAYGPEPTYPAAYYPGGAPPIPAPRTREVWPEARPSFIERLWRRIHPGG